MQPLSAAHVFDVADQTWRNDRGRLARWPDSPGLSLVPPSQQPSSAPGNDAVMASVIEALAAGQSIRGAARTLNLDRNRIARLRRRAIAEGWLTVSPPETGFRRPASDGQLNREARLTEISSRRHEGLK